MTCPTRYWKITCSTELILLSCGLEGFKLSWMLLGLLTYMKVKTLVFDGVEEQSEHHEERRPPPQRHPFSVKLLCCCYVKLLLLRLSFPNEQKLLFFLVKLLLNLICGRRNMPMRRITEKQ